MTDWRTWMTPDEAARYAAIPTERVALTDEARRIRNRAIQRMRRAIKAGTGKPLENDG